MAENVVGSVKLDISSPGAEKATDAVGRFIGAVERAGIVEDKVTKIHERSERSLWSIARQLDTNFRKLDNLARATEKIRLAEDAGLAGTRAHVAARSALAKAINDNALAFSKLETSMQKASAVASGMSLFGGMTDPTNMTRRMSAGVVQSAQAAKLGRNTWANISAQIQDIFVMTFSGASPITTAVQQGPQLLDAMANSSVGFKGALKELGSVALGVATHPVTLITAAIGAAVAATIAWNNQVAALTISLNGLGRQSGMTASQANQVAEAAAGRAGVSNREARGLAGQFLSAGVAGGSVGGAIGLSSQFSRGFGLSLEDAGKELASALADPARGADELAKKYDLVTFPEREHIKRVAALGEKSEATAKLLEALTTHLSNVQDTTSAWGRILDRIGNRMSNKFDKLGQELEIALGGQKSFKDIFDPLRRASELAKQSAADREAERNKELTALREDAAFAVDAIKARTFAEREALAVQRAYTETFRQTKDIVKAGIVAEAERAKLLTESARKVEDLSRTSSDQARLSRMLPFDRRMAEIDIAERDFLRENIPNAASPMAAQFNTVADAAHRVAGAFDGLANKIGAAGGNVLPFFAGGRAPSGADPRGLSNFIRSEATRMGINPNVALRVAQSEGLGSFTGDRGSSFGAFQLHRGGIARGGNAVGGLGDDFFRQTGLDPSNPANERATITYALQKAGQMGWTPFHGAARAGIGRFEGIGANDNAGLSARAGFAEQRATTRFETMVKPIQDANREIERQRAALQSQEVTLGRSTAEVAKATKEQELLSQAQSQTSGSIDKLRLLISATAENYGRFAAEMEAFGDKQRHFVENFDLIRSSARDALGSVTSDLLHGARAGDALKSALDRIADRLISLAADRSIEALFGKSGSASSGGLFGGLLGSLGGGLFGGGGGQKYFSTPLFGGIGKFFGFDGGGVVGRPTRSSFMAPASAFIGAPHFASGGPVPIMAHEGELVLNAAQQHNVAGVIAQGRNNNRASQPPKITINNNATGVSVTPQRMTDGEIVFLIESRVDNLRKNLPQELADHRRRSA